MSGGAYHTFPRYREHDVQVRSVQKPNEEDQQEEKEVRGCERMLLRSSE